MTWLALKPFALAAWRLLSIMIPIPLAVIVAAGLWVHFDKASAIRKAVDNAVTDLVAGAQIEAAKARTAEIERQRNQQAIVFEEFRKRRAAEQRVDAEREERHAKERADYEEKLRTAGRSCRLTDGDIEWLRRP